MRAALERFARWAWTHPGWVAVIVCAPGIAVVVAVMAGRG